MFRDAKQSHGHPNYMVNYIHFLFYTVFLYELNCLYHFGIEKDTDNNESQRFYSTVEKQFAWLKNWKLSISCLPLGNS